jgi:glycosyltransferase involved in cell wall biosynthesis
MPFDPRRPSSILRTWRVLAQELKRCKLVHTMAFSSILVVLLPWLVRRRTWVHTEHWNGVSDPRSVGAVWARLAWLRVLLRLPRRVTGVTTQLVERMEPFLRRGAGVVVPCVVPPVSPLAAYRDRQPLRLVAVGLLNPRKDPLLAVDTIAWLRQRGHDVQLTWVGSGPLEDATRRHAAELGVETAVELVGAVAPEHVVDHLAAGHLFFLPSHQENFFTAVAESISAGRPAVVPLSGGFDDYCTPANSMLLSEWSVETLGSAIVRAAQVFAETTPSEIASTLGDRFSAQTVGRLFTEVYATAQGPRS